MTNRAFAIGFVESARLRRVLTPILFFVLSTLYVYGQESRGRIYGLVTDPAGAAVPQANVTMEEAATGVKTVLITNEEGVYNAPKLATGNYTMEVELTGFKKYVRGGLRLLPGDILELNVPLEVGSVTESLTVTAPTPLVNTTSGTEKSTLDTKTIDTYPLNQRSMLGLLQTVPGAVSGFTAYAINGLDDEKNLASVDGTMTYDPYTNRLVNSVLPPDSLKEVSIETNYSAEYGRTGGALIQMTIKSGTNQLHGSVYDYIRNSALNANTFQNNASGLRKPELQRHEIGFTVGGPIYIPKIYNGTNRTFFFVNWQTQLSPATPYLWARGGLTAAELAGDFSQSKIIPKVTTAAATAPNSPFAGMAGENITNLAPYLNPTAVNLYKAFNLPIVTHSGDQFFQPETQSYNLPDLVMRADHDIKNRHYISFSMNYRNSNPGSTHVNYSPETFLSDTDNKNQHYTIGDTWLISPSKVNDLRLGYERFFQNQFYSSGNLSGLGLPYPVSSLYLTGNNTLAPSLFQIQNTAAGFRGGDTYDLRDTFSWTKANHFMRFGANFWLYNFTQLSGSQLNDLYLGGYLGNEAAEFLIGWPDNGGVSADIYQTTRKFEMAYFFQDDWKVSPRLSVNLGLRYEPYFWAYNKQNVGLEFIPGAKSVKYPNFPSGVITIGDPGFDGRSGVPPDLNNFAPRLGLAYRLNSSGTQVLRGGWGMFYDPIRPTLDRTAMAASFPFFQNYTVSFNRGFPAGGQFLDVPGYSGLGHPNIAVLANPATATFDPKTAYGGFGLINPNTGLVHQWNATYENQFKPRWIASVTYQGHYDPALGMYNFWNVPVLTGSGDSWDVENLAARRPDQNYRYLTYSYYDRRGVSQYNAGVFKLRANTTYFRLSTWYTFAHQLADNGGSLDYNVVEHPGPLTSNDLGPPQQSRKHNFYVVSSWDVPFFLHRNDLTGRLLGGWNATATFLAESGQPVDVYAVNNSFQCSACTMRPTLTGQPLITPNWQSNPNLPYVNPAAFTEPANGTYGNFGYDHLNWTPTKNVDMTVMKSFRLYEDRVKLDVRFDFFNLFNWVNWVPASTSINISSPISLTMKNNWSTAPRNIQLGARISW